MVRVVCLAAAVLVLAGCDLFVSQPVDGGGGAPIDLTGEWRGAYTFRQLQIGVQIALSQGGCNAYKCALGGRVTEPRILDSQGRPAEAELDGTYYFREDRILIEYVIYKSDLTHHAFSWWMDTRFGGEELAGYGIDLSAGSGEFIDGGAISLERVPTN